MYSSDYDSMATGLAALGGIAIVAMLIGLAVAIVVIIAQWKIFEKAGEAGWKCLIPYYNNYVMFNFTWNTTMFWIFLGLSLGGGILSLIFAPLGTIASIATFVIAVMQTHKLSLAFGHGVGFTLGLIFLSPIFYIILAFGDSEYIGPQ